MSLKPRQVLLLNKPVGKTPLDMIKRLKTIYPQYKNSTLGYAGRLDPMAEGLLLILVGDENKKRTSYERLNKEYEFSVVFGVSTDSHDTLGIPQIHDTGIKPSQLKSLLGSVAKRLTGTHDQPYPPYSAARVCGKPLFWWARHSRLDEITIPSKQITIHSITCTDISECTLEKVANIAIKRAESVHGEFRQTEIIQAWEKLHNDHPHILLPVCSFHISCSSGTYIRSLAMQMGQHVGCGALALSIKRTKIGPHQLEDALSIQPN